ncbi:2-C-methyl-D-erythritol 4-phosphate cytidylyltransferase [uncultured Desulfosarcina sp.]|uniref:2-C-methyl-D-erythritol 4-phosphate cytidylyltransferase n=1 Tax=uncultured Desulfosarcina sp. TaxID=218289 RepID=UPI0029C6CC53|nr:2-C-methyl-D-erythritol 4-phosphate cytidylyltransferase [uncultured Desulfosarcina sp.]
MICAVIVAGGSGSRMQAPVKKQYLQLDGIPILSRTLMAFDGCSDLERIVLVLPEPDLERFRKEILLPLKLTHDVRLAVGGEDRQASVRNGLEEAGPSEGVVMIHDGVRPFVRAGLIRVCIAGAKATGACVPVIAATDTVKQVDDSGFIVCTLDRDIIRLAQTPQVFGTGLIRQAHQRALVNGFAATDDASVAEFAGERVHTVPGDPDNIKITHPQDLAIAGAILSRWREEGIG